MKKMSQVGEPQLAVPPNAAQSAPPSRRRQWPRPPESMRLLVPLVVAIVGLGAYTTTQSDVFLTWDNIQGILLQVATLAVLSVGMTLLMVAGQLDLSVGAGATFIGVVAAKLINGGMSELLTVVVCLAIGAAIGVIIGTVVAVTRVAPFILTLGALSVLSSFALILAGGQPVAASTAFTGFGLNEVGGVPLPVVLAVALFLAGAFLLRYTRLGRNAFAVGSNEDAAYLAAIPVGGVKIWLFALNGLLVGVAAIVLVARLGAGDPRGGSGLELQAIAAVVLGGATLSGGRGSMLGTFLGVFLLGEVQNALNLLNVQAFYQNVVLGAILILAVVITALGERRRASRAGRSWRLMLRRPGPKEAVQ